MFHEFRYVLENIDEDELNYNGNIMSMKLREIPL